MKRDMRVLHETLGECQRTIDWIESVLDHPFSERRNMPRIRSIKPEFWTSGQVLECSTNVRLLFIGLWNFCDDAGRHPDRPKQIKAEVFPADSFTEDDIRGMIDELSANGLIKRYVVDGQRYFQVTGWHHQRIDKPQDPKYPGPFQDHSGNDPGTIPPDTIRSDTIGGDTKDLSGNGSNGPDHEPPTEPPPDPEPDDFDRFWSAYPRKEGKKKARTAWRNLSQSKRTAALADCATRYQHVEKAFIPLPTTYLHGERWNDEPIPPKTYNFGPKPVDNSGAADEAIRRFRERQANAGE